MRTANDAHRSLARFIWQTLGDSYSIYLTRIEGEFLRPGAVVRALGPTQTVQGGFRKMDYIQPFAIHVYPTTPEAGEYEEAFQMATQIQDDIVRAMALGEGDAPGYPMRIPLLDYENIGLYATPPDAPIKDYLRVNSISGEAAPDPEDDQLFMIVITIRCSWRSVGGLSPHITGTGPILEDINVGP